MKLETDLPFALVDVFAAGPFGGNPLPVVEGAEKLSTARLKSIAREFNQSETTFVLQPTRPDAHLRLRSFTAAGIEVFGAGGHNTLGAWWWLAQSGKLSLGGKQTSFTQEIGDRVLSVAIVAADGMFFDVVMNQECPSWGAMVTAIDGLASALSLPAQAIDVALFRVQVVSTGAAHLMVPLRDAATVDSALPNATALLPILQSAGAEGCYIFSLGQRNSLADVYARFFNPTVGIAEDPATGTAAGPLAAHLVKHCVVPEGMVTVEQGTLMGRTSLIRVEVEGDVVRVHGRGVLAASGILHSG